jgi:hypothetical protein
MKWSCNRKAVFYAWSVQSGYKEEFRVPKLAVAVAERPACQDMSLQRQQSRVFGIDNYRVTARKELGSENNSCVI